MERVLLTAIILLMTMTVLYAQQNNPTRSEVRQDAQQYLEQTRVHSDEFESILADLRARNMNNDDAATFLRLRREIDRLEAGIEAEKGNIEVRLNRGQRVSADVINRFERMVDQHRAKITELEVFLATH